MAATASANAGPASTPIGAPSPSLAQSWQAAMDKVYGITRNADGKIVSQTNETVRTMEMVITGFTSGLANGIKAFMDDILVKGKSLAQGLHDIAMSMVEMVIDVLARMAAEWIAKHLIMTAVSKLFNITQATSSEAAAVATIAANKTTALATIAGYKAMAEAGQMAAYAAIPFAGIGLGVSGAATEEGIIDGFMAKAAFLAKGGIVTGPTLAMIGEGRGPEAVIPLDSGRGKQMLSGSPSGAGGSGDVHIHINGTFIEGNQASWERMVRNVIVPAMERHGRKTKLTRGKVW